MTRPEIVSVVLSLCIHLGLLRTSLVQNPSPFPIGDERRQAVDVELVSSQRPPEEAPPSKPEPSETIQAPSPEELTIPKPSPKQPKTKKQQPKPIPISPPKNDSNVSEALNDAHSMVTEAPTAPSAEVFSLYNPKPPYPTAARRLRHEGTSVVRVIVSASGRAKNVSIEKTSGFPELDESAVATVKSWRFQPGTLAGTPIESQVEIPIKFQLVD